MRRVFTLVLSTLFVTGAISAPALSKDVPQHGAKTAPAMPKSEKVPNTGGVSPESGTTGSISRDSRDDAMNTLLSAISDAHSSATALGAMRKISAVRVVRVHDIAKGDDARTVASAMKDNRKDRDALQSAIRSNATLAKRLAAKGTKPAQVVAAKIEADGSVTVFAD